MSISNDKKTVVIKGNEYIMPQAAKPTITARPRPAPMALAPKSQPKK